MQDDVFVQNSITNICNILQNATHKNHVDLALSELLKLIEIPSIKIQSQELNKLFRDKTYAFIFSKGDIADSFYICLYAIMDSQTDTRFDAFIRIADNNLFVQGISEEESTMLLELGCIAKILAGNKRQAIKDYIKNISLTDIHSVAAQKSYSFILKAFGLLDIPFELFLEAMRETLDTKNILLQDPKRRRSIFNWQIHVFWNIKHFFNHRDWLSLYPLWEKVFYEMLDSSHFNKIDEALYLQFFIYHMCGNSFTSEQEWKNFNEKITQKASSIYQEFASNFHLPQPTPHTKPKKIIAFLRDRLVENSPYKVEYSFLKNLMQNKDFKQHYEIKIYIMGFLEKSDDDKAIKQAYEDLGIKIIDVINTFNQQGYYNSHLSKALSIREAIIADKTDILISPNNGYGISDFILASRAAPMQIFWSHGNFVYDLPQIDLRMTHICGNAPYVSYAGYNFVGIGVHMDKNFYDPYVPQDLINKERDKYPPHKIILGVIGRLTKIDSLAYLQTIITIMQKNPNTIFLACGNGNVYEIKQKIISLDPHIIHRFFFPGYVDSRIYGHIIDFWPDSFPMQQGESKVEFNAKGGIILNLSKEDKQERKDRLEKWIEQNNQIIQEECKKEKITLDFLKKIWIEDISCIAFDRDDYLNKALNILKISQEEKQNLSANRLLIRRIYDHILQIKGIHSFLRAIQNHA
ncbi:hypothetical protein [Helicobacter sp. 11S03491-1]|uniref:hypothetical protein n=1 Tax=Helicobacter sp. 11S03491-1 TaxID=1476196 RepID=UPI000BA61FF4|nr:hypothetical protein [Helicobacter sp. 11S03491-1]PAF43010.1 hypothetical protein BKH45_02765 [Helicobacter sp. 11S03491-1]